MLSVALPGPFNEPFYYAAEEKPLPGCRVIVPFGTSLKIGVVTEVQAYNEKLLERHNKKIKIKAVQAVVDHQPLIAPKMLKMALWLSSYYLHPIGEVLKSFMASDHKLKTVETWELSPKGLKIVETSTDSTDENTPACEVLKYLFFKNKKLLKSTLQSKLRSYFKDSDKTKLKNYKVSLDELKDKKWVRINKVKSFDIMEEKFEETPDQPQRQITDPSQPYPPTLEQKNALEILKSSYKLSQADSMNAKAHLMLGVTGSGKTEIFLKIISHIFADHHDNAVKKEGFTPQVLILVPEISLTPQMTMVFEQRFPGRIGVAHSGLSVKEKFTINSKIRKNQLQILIGPRSAVFAPFQNLQLIIVDEEHDSSYKQSSKFCYHGRDVAVLRGQFEKCLVLLSSATPSLESYYNAISGRYTLIELTKRANNQELPAIETIPMPQKQRGVLFRHFDQSQDWEESGALLDESINEALLQNLSKKEQCIVLINRRGLVYQILDLQNKEPLKCKNCSISLTLHRKKFFLLCHYCGYKESLQRLLQDNPKQKLLGFGNGSQKVEAYLTKKFPLARIARLDSDNTENKDSLYETLRQFREHEIDILVGTQMLSKGHDFSNVTLTVITEIDHMLNYPDFRSGERVYDLIVQTAGRAGRSSKQGKVLLQTSLGQNDPIIKSACDQNYKQFAEDELRRRKRAGFPPFKKMALWDLSSTDPHDLLVYAHKVQEIIKDVFLKDPQISKKVKIVGPVAPSMERIQSRYRQVFLLTAASQMENALLYSLCKDKFPLPNKNLRFKIDVDPQNIS